MKVSFSLEYLTDIPYEFNIIPNFLAIDKTIAFSWNPFPTAPGSYPPCPGSINTFNPPGISPPPLPVSPLPEEFPLVY